MNPMRAMALLTLLALAAGCSNPYRESYSASPLAGAPPASPSKQPVAIREVEAARLDAHVSAYRARREASDKAIEDFTEAEHAEEMNRLLTVLRIPGAFPDVVVLGVSDFRLSGSGAFNATQATEEARRHAADTVVYCRRYLGRYREVDHVPVTERSTYYGRRYDRRTGRSYGYSSTFDSTTWVPVAVDRDAWRLTVFYLRHDSTP